jgi:hypothetical protein
MSMTGWTLYAPGDAWIADLLDGPWTLEALTEPAGGWHGAFFVHSQEQPWEVERRLGTVSGRHAIPMLACYVETSDFGYALALRRGELVARYVVNAHSAGIFVEGVWAVEQCVALHGRDWQQAGLEGMAGWSDGAPRPLTTSQLGTLLAGEHLFPEDPLFGGLGLALGIEAPRPLEANVGVMLKGEIPPEHQQVVAAAFESVGVAARVWVGPAGPGLGDLQCMVLAHVRLQVFLDSVGSNVAEGAHEGLKRLVDRILVTGPRPHGPCRCWYWRTILRECRSSCRLTCRLRHIDVWWRLTCHRFGKAHWSMTGGGDSGTPNRGSSVGCRHRVNALNLHRCWLGPAQTTLALGAIRRQLVARCSSTPRASHAAVTARRPAPGRRP